MPELPEVETIARSLRPVLVGRTIRAGTVLWARTIACPEAGTFQEAVAGRRVVAVGRRGKYLVLELDRGWLLLHLKMSGRLRLEAEGGPPGPHTRLALALDGGAQLLFDDARKFGRAYLVDDPAEVTAGLGPEPLAEGFGLDELRQRLGRRSGRLKPLLLDQRFVAGLGNIYADEALFEAGLHPLRRADSLDADEQERLFRAVRGVLGRAVAGRGTTLSDRGYADARGEAGAFQEELAVYGRKGQACRRCGTAIERMVIGQRSAHYCPQCQRP